MKKIIILFIVFIICVLVLSGCGKLETERSIKQYIYEKYGIEAEVLSHSEGNDSTKPSEYQRCITYEMKEKDREVFFYCKSYFGENLWWYQAKTDDNYYEKLTEYNKADIEMIEEKYNIELKNTSEMIEEKYNIELKDTSRIIDALNINVLSGDVIDYSNIENALNELMTIYDLKKIDDYWPTVTIYINNERTDIYYPYVYAGNKVARHNTQEEFVEDMEIPAKFDEELKEYVKDNFPEGSYVVGPKADYTIEVGSDKGIEYEIKNDNLDNDFNVYENLDKKVDYSQYEKLGCRFAIDSSGREHILIDVKLDNYKEDMKNNSLKNFKEYIINYYNF